MNESYENEVTKYIMQIKTNIENGESISYDCIVNVLSVCLHLATTLKDVEKQLDYALDNNGEYLKIYRMEN